MKLTLRNYRHNDEGATGHVNARHGGDDLAREQELGLALQGSRMDVARITIQVRGCTVLLGGRLAHSQDRDEIVGCVMGKGITRVVDAMTLAGEKREVYIYLAPGSQPMRDAIADAYDTPSTRDKCGASTIRDWSADFRRWASPSRVESVRMYARRAIRWLVSPFSR